MLKIQKYTKNNGIIFINDIETKTKSGHRMCLLKCHCGKTFEYNTSKFNLGKVKSCGCLSNSKLLILSKTSLNPDYPFYVILNKIRTRKKRANKIGFDITEEQLKELWIKQDGKCFYTGIKLILPKSFPQSYHKLSPSIDRIDSSKPYTISNIQIVHKQVNFMKQSMSHDEFIYFCKTISNKF